MAKMLIIDHEIEITDFLKSFFVEHGFDVATAMEGKEALKIVDDFSPKIVLCDLRMQDVPGIELLKKIKKKDKNIKVIVIAEQGDKELEEEALKLGADDYIEKPFSLIYLEKNVIMKTLSFLSEE